MTHREFYPPHEGIAVSALAEKLGVALSDISHADTLVHAIAPVNRAKKGEICYISSRKNRQDLETCEASAIFCSKGLSALVPEGIAVLISDNPQKSFAESGALLHPTAMRPAAIVSGLSGVSPAAYVDPTARLEEGVIVEPMAVIGEGAEIGSGTQIGAGAIIGAHVKIGRNSSIAAGATILSAYIGNNVIIHNGARIGQDGFGYAPGPRGMLKLVQVGRVIIQDHVEIGANTTIDRGAMDDTVIGEGTKIDNQVQIGHNVKIGRHCGIVSKVGIAGSTVIGNGVMIGGAAGINGHIQIGDGVQIAAMSGVLSSIPPGQVYGGVPARPMKDVLRDWAEVMARSDERASKKGETNG